MTLSDYERKFNPCPDWIIDSLSQAWPMVDGTLDGEELTAWADVGVEICHGSSENWEVIHQYLKSSVYMVHALPFVHLKQWAYWGSMFAGASHDVAIAYFKASPYVTKYMKPWDVTEWAQLGKKLYDKSNGYSQLSSLYFDNSKDLLRFLSFSEFQHLILIAESMADKSIEQAAEFMDLSGKVLPGLREDTRSCLSLVSALIKNQLDQVPECIRIIEKVLSRVERSERSKFLALAGRVAEMKTADIAMFLKDGSESLGQIDSHSHTYILNMAEHLSSIESGIVLDYMRNAPHLLKRISINQLQTWCHAGSIILQENREAGEAFFKCESRGSNDLLDKLSVCVELAGVKEVMRLYCRALSALDIDVTQHTEDSAIGKGWVGLERMITDGATVNLPAVSEHFDTKDDNFDWYKVVATHQVAHLEFRSHGFSLDTPATQFSDMKNQRIVSVNAEAISTHQMNIADNLTGHSESDRRIGPTDIQQFFASFSDVTLARDIFTAVEDYRLDHRVKIEYPGIKVAYNKVQDRSLLERPPIDELPGREALVELLIRFSLQQGHEMEVPPKYYQWANQLWPFVQPLMNLESVVEDSAEATIRLYDIILQVPNEDLSDPDAESNDFAGNESGDDEQQEDGSSSFDDELTGSEEEGDSQEKPYQSPQQVSYRGDFKPELMQVISSLRESQKERGNKPVSREEVEQLLNEVQEDKYDSEAKEVDQDGQLAAQRIKDLASKESPWGSIKPNQFFADGGFEEEEQGGPLAISEPGSFLYDEWDYRMADYRPRWCLLREKDVAEGDSTYYMATLDSYRALAMQIRRQFELMVPQGLLKAKRQQDGDELELDAVLEAVIDRRSGVTPSEKVYVRRNKVQRDVAVVFLLDMSASTAEAIDESRRMADEWDAPDDPMEYMFWLRSRRGEGVRRSYKRIVDLEKEGLVLLINALEAIGDTYGIYGVSGYGRENVDFFVIKDIEEAFSEKIKRRIDKISPLQATRMGPAIRHAVTKLDDLEARTKFLILISDGRPQDRGYSREGVEKEYAIHDTRVALNEARKKGITPFCLTVDKEGHDYLRAMCQDMGYEVLADIHSLPRRLPALYRRLTI